MSLSPQGRKSRTFSISHTVYLHGPWATWRPPHFVGFSPIINISSSDTTLANLSHSLRKDNHKGGEVFLLLNSPSKMLFFTLGSCPSRSLSLSSLGRIVILLDCRYNRWQYIVFLFPYIEVQKCLMLTSPFIITYLLPSNSWVHSYRQYTFGFCPMNPSVFLYWQYFGLSWAYQQNCLEVSVYWINLYNLIFFLDIPSQAHIKWHSFF